MLGVTDLVTVWDMLYFEWSSFNISKACDLMHAKYLRGTIITCVRYLIKCMIHSVFAVHASAY